MGSLLRLQTIFQMKITGYKTICYNKRGLVMQGVEIILI